MIHALPEYKNTSVLVVGDVMLDSYWHGTTSRISPEAPVPVVKINQCIKLPGGAANVALNIQSLESKALLLSTVGEDVHGDDLKKLLEQKKIKVYFKRSKNQITTHKIRVLSLHQQLIRLDFEEAGAVCINIKDYKNILEKNKNIKTIILSDYNKGVLENIADLIYFANQKKIPVLIDPKGNDYSRYKNAFLLTPNRKEFEAVVGRCHSEKEMIEKALNLIKKLNLNALLITRGEEGMTLVQVNKNPIYLKAQKQEVYDVTGAGDTVIGVLAASLGAGLSLEKSVELSNIAAGIVVSKLGAATVTPHELRRAIHQEEKKVLTEKEAVQLIHDAKAHGEKIVMTNGCFDILHPGHIAYLEEAKKLGDRLIIAVNSDSSVKSLKGDSRPINSLEHRMQVLAGLQSVDWVVSFTEKTPEKLINQLLPDILVKGGDWPINKIAGHKAVLKNGGEVKSLSFINGYSTTKIVNKISKI